MKRVILAIIVMLCWCAVSYGQTFNIVNSNSVKDGKAQASAPVKTEAQSCVDGQCGNCQCADCKFARCKSSKGQCANGQCSKAGSSKSVSYERSSRSERSHRTRHRGKCNSCGG